MRLRGTINFSVGSRTIENALIDTFSRYCSDAIEGFPQTYGLHSDKKTNRDVSRFTLYPTRPVQRILWGVPHVTTWWRQCTPSHPWTCF
jgi:hypothetical protein